jgi:WhiB family redox-sensing transcriptional regulator
MTTPTARDLHKALARAFGYGNFFDHDLDWRVDARCTQVDPEIFYPDKGGTTKGAKRVCAGCPVRANCLEFALDHDERWGVWGGLSQRERERLLKLRAQNTTTTRSTTPPARASSAA